MKRKAWVLAAAAGLTVSILGLSATAIVWIGSPGPAGMRPAAPEAPAAPAYQPQSAKQPAASQPLASKGPLQHEVKRPPADDQPPYGLPLQIHLDPPDVPAEIRNPSAPVP